MRLADSLLLPLNCSDYAESLEQYLDEAVKAFEAKLLNNGISMGEQITFMHNFNNLHSWQYAL